MSSQDKDARVRELEDRILRLEGDLRKVEEQRARQERIFDSHRTLLRRVNADLQNEIRCRALAVAELKASEARFRGIFETARDCIFVKDVLLHFTHVNKAMEETFGIPRERFLGLESRNLFPREQADQIQAIDMRVLRGEIVRNEEHLVILGETRVFDVTKVPLRNERGAILGLCAIAREITEQRRLEAENVRATHLAAIGELAAGVAHEINNPINGVINYAQLLVDLLGEEHPQAELARKIIHESSRIAELVRNLLGFARSPRRSRAAVRLDQVVDKALELIRTKLARENILVELRLPEELPDLQANFSSLQQVFINLLTNARQALNELPSSVERRLIVEAWTREGEDGSWLVVEVADNGPGMGEETLRGLFNPFFTTKSHGSGLGLGICQRIIHDHGGVIRVESAPGQGARFLVELPTASA